MSSSSPIRITKDRLNGTSVAARISTNASDQRFVTLSICSSDQDANPKHESHVDVYLHGAHVTRWVDSSTPEPLLFLSEHAVLDGSKAIRGGIPLIFPQFSGFGPIKSHGFARVLEWELLDVTTNLDDDDDAPEVPSLTARFGLAQSAKTNEIWQAEHAFRCEFAVTLAGAGSSTLECSWKVTNLNDDQPFTFATAMHTYFTVGDIGSVTVESGSESEAPLKGVGFIDQLDSDTPDKVQASESISFAEEVDRIYMQVPRHLKVVDRSLQRSIHLATTSLPDAVVWNPWVDKSKRMGDFGDLEYKRMVCVEAADLGMQAKNELAPGSTWHGSQLLSFTQDA